MSGRHSFQELKEGFSPERRRRIEAIKEKLLADMAATRAAPGESTDTTG